MPVFTFTAPISTERLTLRRLDESDLDDVHSYQSREDVSQYLLWEVKTLEESRERLADRASVTTLANDGDVLVVAVELPATGRHRARVIGEISLVLSSAAHRQAEIGYIFHPDFQGKGYATEAAEKMLELAFTELGAHRVIADLDPRNLPSAALAQRLDMRQEAYFREDVFFKGEWGDTLLYAILESEWKERQLRG